MNKNLEKLKLKQKELSEEYSNLNKLIDKEIFGNQSSEIERLYKQHFEGDKVYYKNSSEYSGKKKIFDYYYNFSVDEANAEIKFTYGEVVFNQEDDRVDFRKVKYSKSVHYINEFLKEKYKVTNIETIKVKILDIITDEKFFI